MKTIFLQPRHNYAPEEGHGHIHLSAPLMTAAAQIKQAGYNGNIEMRDENFEAQKVQSLDADVVGINLIGAPYIPVVKNILETRVRVGTTLLLGGQIVDGLSAEEFDVLFRTRKDIAVINGNIPENICGVFGLHLKQIPPQTEVSSIPVWETLNDETLKVYLQHEFSFYLGQGCKFNCNFCQAKKAQPEKYRNLEISEKDLGWLAERARDFQLNSMKFYLSNLDILQTPKMFQAFCGIVKDVRKATGVEIHFRGLATILSMLQTAHIATFIAAKQAGLTAIGFGADGASEAIWASVNKKHNRSVEDAKDAIRTVRQLGFQPEVLMVCGFPADNEQTLQEALDFSRQMKEEVDAIIRPHAAKDIIPGAEAWTIEENKEIVDDLLKHPERFQALDYLALPSEVTHPDPDHRAVVTRYFKELCDMDERSSDYIYPDTPEYQQVAIEMGTTVKALNEGRYDR